MGKQNQLRNQTRQAFLLTFFGNDPYEVKEINGFYLEKHPNGNTGGSEVAIYSSDAYLRKTNFLKTHSQLSNKENELPF